MNDKMGVAPYGKTIYNYKSSAFLIPFFSGCKSRPSMPGRVDNVGGDSNRLVLEPEAECCLLTESVFTSLSIQ